MIHRFIIAVRQDKATARCFLNKNFTEIEWRSQRGFEQLFDGVRHIAQATQDTCLAPKVLCQL
ncbi:MAG: hypothetical protein DMF12_00180 [Verrucomicrobia bacterium]|nr:MAG: hypothetical protein DMF12_00180 [Verrucomicrobiota bacterium]